MFFFLFIELLKMKSVIIELWQKQISCPNASIFLDYLHDTIDTFCLIHSNFSEKCL